MGIRVFRKTIQKVQSKVFVWYRRFGRHTLPWRRTTDPYNILVSEIMLQQTQVDAVIPKYRAFVKRFPTFRALSRARSREVIQAWKGLGYNRRALNLWKTAQIVVRDYDGKLPNATEELWVLPGIGPYTAESVRVFVFHEATAALDTNIRRVVHRVWVGSDVLGVKVLDAELVELAQKVVPARRSYDWNSALMDLGSAVCKSRPLCEACPLKDVCKSYPEILTQKKVGTRRAEPHPKSTPHIPNRIYRGRVVELLRTRRSVLIKDLGPKIKPDFSREDDAWLVKILDGLSRDGLIHLTKTRVSLP